MAPGFLEGGKTRGRGVREGPKKLSRLEILFRRLGRQQANSPQFLVRENHLLAAITSFQVTQAGNL